VSLLFTSPRTERALNGAEQGNGLELLPAPEQLRRTAGQVVTTESALRLSTVWACVRLRAELLSTLLLGVYRNVGGRPVPAPTPKVLVAPGGDQVDIVDWLHMSQVSLDLRGNAFGLVVDRDGLGYPRQIELQNPDAVAPWVDADGKRRYRVGGKVYPASEVWHERAYVFPGRTLGLSPIAFAAVSMGVAIAAEQFGANWFADGAHPSAILTTTGDVKQGSAQIVKDRFLNAIRGKREPVVLGNDVKYQAIQVAPNESQFLDTQKWSVPQICRLFGVPPELVGGEAGNSLTYANVEQRGLDFLTYGFGPTLARRQTALTRLTPRPQYVRFNAGALLRTDLKARYDSYRLGLEAGFLGEDEVRALEERGPLVKTPADRLARGAKVVEQLVRAGFDPADVLAALGLPGMEHTGEVHGGGGGPDATKQQVEEGS